MINRLVKCIAVMLVALVPLVGIPSSYADDGNSTVLSSTYIAENDPNVNQIVLNSKRLTGYEILSYNGKTGVVSFNYQNYNKIPDKQDFLVKVLTSVNKSGLGSQRKLKLYNFIAQQDGSLSATVKKLTVDGSADFYTASSWLQPFSGTFSTILGFLTIVLTALMSFSVILDAAVIALPGLRGLATLEGRSGVASKMSNIVSADCRHAIKVEDTSGQQAVWVWMRRRFISLTLVSFMILWLVTGTLYSNIGWILSSFGVGNV